jgi:hypothetical protein
MTGMQSIQVTVDPNNTLGLSAGTPGVLDVNVVAVQPYQIDVENVDSALSLTGFNSMTNSVTAYLAAVFPIDPTQYRRFRLISSLSPSHFCWSHI